jgi:hypothetical protein
LDGAAVQHRRHTSSALLHVKSARAAFSGLPEDATMAADERYADNPTGYLYPRPLSGGGPFA